MFNVYIIAYTLNDYFTAGVFILFLCMFEIKQTILLSSADFLNRIQTSTIECLFLSIPPTLTWKFATIFSVAKTFEYSQGTKAHTITPAHISNANIHLFIKWLTSWVRKFKRISHFSFPFLRFRLLLFAELSLALRPISRDWAREKKMSWCWKKCQYAFYGIFVVLVLRQ